MFCNKHLYHLFFCEFNVESMIRLTISNLSLRSVITSKLRFAKKKYVFASTCTNGGEDKTSVNKKDSILLRNRTDKRLFGRLMKRGKGKCVLILKNETESKGTFVNEDDPKRSEHLWVLKASDVRNLRYVPRTKEKGKELSVNYEKYSNIKDTSQLQNISKYISENLAHCIFNSYFTVPPEGVENITSFSISGTKTLENGAIKDKEIENSDIPSVTRVLQETMSINSRIALEHWKKNMINKLGVEEFDIFCKELLKNGRLFHACIENILLQKEVEIPSEVRFLHSSVQPVLEQIQAVQGVETRVLHPNLRYKGIADCIASYRDRLHLIDWKRSTKRKSTLAATYDAPVQLAAYIGAVNASNQYPFKVDRGLVVTAYTNGEPATVHEVKDDVLEKSWQEWLKRLQQFYINLNKKNE